ncbi:hypothetical protein B0H19DRAFT_1081124 [Mycena capillaripes]|nr:hypothetical protein B0H19DRAFT_1081124 [Mycena capillaripes]
MTPNYIQGARVFRDTFPAILDLVLFSQQSSSPISVDLFRAYGNSNPQRRIGAQPERPGRFRLAPRSDIYSRGQKPLKSELYLLISLASSPDHDAPALLPILNVFSALNPAQSCLQAKMQREQLMMAWKVRRRAPSSPATFESNSVSPPRAVLLETIGAGIDQSRDNACGNVYQLQLRLRRCCTSDRNPKEGVEKLFEVYPSRYKRGDDVNLGRYISLCLCAKSGGPQPNRASQTTGHGGKIYRNIMRWLAYMQGFPDGDEFNDTSRAMPTRWASRDLVQENMSDGLEGKGHSIPDARQVALGNTRIDGNSCVDLDNAERRVNQDATSGTSGTLG